MQDNNPFALLALVSSSDENHEIMPKPLLFKKPQGSKLTELSLLFSEVNLVPISTLYSRPFLGETLTGKTATGFCNPLCRLLYLVVVPEPLIFDLPSFACGILLSNQDHARSARKTGPSGGAPKERRRGHAEKRLSKRMFLESPFLLCSLKVFRTFQVF